MKKLITNMLLLAGCLTVSLSATSQEVTVRTGEYWIDGCFDDRISIDFSGNWQTEIDVSPLCKGVHTFGFRAADSKGRWSSPIVRYFLRAGRPLGDNAINAYAYWFNRGPKTLVEVDPANPLVISDLWIDIKDIVPNEIAADYRFDTETETVYTDDNVFFGMEAYDLAGQVTQAVLSDTFAMTVPVRPDFTDLVSGIPVTFDAPQAGYISGFRMRADVGDSLVWTLSGGCTADAYTSDGRRIDWNGETDEDGRQVFAMKAETALTYVLVHHASTALGELDIVCDNTSLPSGIATRTTGCTFRADRRRLTVESSDGGDLRVVSTSGVTAFSGKVESGTAHITLPSGVYLLRWNGTAAGKLLVP